MQSFVNVLDRYAKLGRRIELIANPDRLPRPKYTVREHTETLGQSQVTAAEIVESENKSSAYIFKVFADTKVLPKF